MFHLQNGLFFQRLKSGQVRIVKTRDGGYPIEVNGINGQGQSNILFDEVTTDSGWASVVASVSARGETLETYTEALTNHNLTVLTPSTVTPATAQN